MTVTIIVSVVVFIIAFGLGYLIATLVANSRTAKFQAYMDIENVIKQEFTFIASETIKKEQEDLRKQNKEALDEKLSPLSDKLKDFQSKVEKLNEEGIKNTSTLLAELNLLKENNKKISDEAHKLTTALTKDQNVKGAFGEGLLEQVLQSAGLCENVHYLKQFKTQSINEKGETKDIKPDIVINLPDHKHLIIDAKFTLESFSQFQNAEEKSDKEAAYKLFKDAIKSRIKELATKNYKGAEGLNQPDFIFLYIPLENSLATVYQDDDLINEAHKSNVILIGTASLIAAIKLINKLWAEQRRNENLDEISKAGTNLYETFVLFCDDLMKLEDTFKGVSSQFIKTINRFKRNNASNPSIFSQVEKLKELGVVTSKQIPQNLLEEFEEPQEITS